MTILLAILIASLPFGQDAKATTRPAVERHAPRADLLAAMPNEACVVIIGDMRAARLSDDMIAFAAKSVANRPDDAEKLVKLASTLRGRIAFGWVAPPKDREGDIILALDVESPEFDLHDWTIRTLLPVWQSFGRRGEFDALRIEGDGKALRIVDPGKANTLLYLAQRDRIVVAATKGELARRAGATRDARDGFADEPAIRKLSREMPNEAPLVAYFHPQRLMERIGEPSRRSAEAILLKILNPADLTAAGGFVRWTERSLDAGIVAILADECSGAARWFDRPGSETTLLPQLAGDFTLVVRANVPSLARVPEELFAVADRIDPTFRVEHREDLAAFKKQTGVDLHADILAQIGGEIAVAIRPDLAHEPPIAWAAVAPIKDAAVLQSACAKLVAHFGLTTDERTSEGVTYYSPRDAMPCTWCLVNNHLILADSLDTARDVARRLKGGGIKPSPAIVRGLRDLGGATQLLALADVGLLMRQAPMLGALAGTRFAGFLNDGYVGASLTSADRIVRFNFRWDMGRGATRKSNEGDSDSEQAWLTVVQTTFEAVGRARDQARGVVVMTNQRNAAMALMIYADAHGGRFPDSLESVVREMPDAVSIDLFANPYTGDGPRTPDEIAEHSHMHNRPGLTTKSAPDEIILAERTVRVAGDSTGASFTFVDGHVEFITEPLASRLIEMIETGESIVTRAAAEASLGDDNAP